jgi:hypothetical protein
VRDGAALESKSERTDHMSDDVVVHEDTHSLVPALRNTLDDVLRDKTINKMFGGKDEKLSQAQAGLATAVTVKMQDRLVEQMARSHDRELRLIAGFWKLYTMPVLRYRPVEVGGSKGYQRADSKKGSVLRVSAGLFSWGNLIGGAAIVIVAMAFYYTKLTASYKEQWKNADSQIGILDSKLKAEIQADEALQVQLAKAEARADSLQTTLATLTSSNTEQQKLLSQTIEGLSEKRGELAKQIAASASEKTFQILYERDEKELRKLRQDKADVDSNLARAEEQLKSKQ